MSYRRHTLLREVTSLLLLGNSSRASRILSEGWGASEASKASACFRWIESPTERSYPD